MIERRVQEPMVDFTLFRSQTFLGTNAIAFIVSFAMLAMFFFIALYMQNILGYSAIEAGVRFLPSTLMIVLIAPLAGRLTDRIGPRPLIVSGLTLVTIALFLQTRIDLDTGYGLLLPAFILMGIGMALTMSPMSTAAMNAVDAAEGRRGVRDPVDEPDGRRHLRRGRAGRPVQHLARNELSDSLAGTGIGAAQQERLVETPSGTASDGGEPAARGRRRGAQRVHPRARQRHVAVGGRGRARRGVRLHADRRKAGAPPRRRHGSRRPRRPRPSKRPRPPSRTR